jgi:hypothetical protein
MSIKARLARLQRVASAHCPQCHGFPRETRISQAWNGETVEPFPGPDAPDNCACGRRISYTHIVLCCEEQRTDSASVDR